MNMSRTRTIVGLLAAAGLAQCAAAQVQWRVEGAPSGTPAPSHTIHMSSGHGGGHGAGQGSSSNAVVRTIIQDGDDRTVLASGTSDSGHKYEIKVKNDTVEAKLDGKRVPDDRIRVSDDSVELVDENGNTVVTLSIGDDHVGSAGAWVTPAPGGAFAAPSPMTTTSGGTWTLDAPGAFSPIEGGAVAIAQMEPPKVMVGINMSDVDGTLREHFGLDEDAGIVVDNVVDGLPASKAGIKARDIIISIDGTNVTNSTLRDALNEKEPGQRVQVVLLRKGEKKDVEMQLEAYDASKLGITTPLAMAYGDQSFDPFFGDEASKEEMEAARKALHDAMSSLSDQHSAEMDQAREQIQRAMRELEAAHALRGQRSLSGDQLRNLYVVPSAPAAPSEPGTPTPPNEAGQGRLRYQVLRDPVGSDRMESLEDRLDQLDERLDKLDSRIERLLEKLERDN